MKKLLLFGLIFSTLASCSKDEGDRSSWNDPVIPVDLMDIQAVNIDNSGEFPVIIPDSSEVSKNAYMVGIKWQTAVIPGNDDDFITDPIDKGEQVYEAFGDNYKKRILCNTAFSATVPAGSNVSKFFKEMDAKHLPSGVDEGFVLLTAPDPGMHSFKVEYYSGNTLKFSHDTPIIKFN